MTTDIDMRAFKAGGQVHRLTPEFLMLAVMGKIKGVSVLEKFGENPDIDTADGFADEKIDKSWLQQCGDKITGGKQGHKNSTGKQHYGDSTLNTEDNSFNLYNIRSFHAKYGYGGLCTINDIQVECKHEHQ